MISMKSITCLKNKESEIVRPKKQMEDFRKVLLDYELLDEGVLAHPILDATKERVIIVLVEDLTNF